MILKQGLKRAWTEEVGSRLNHEGREDRVPQCVDIEWFVARFEQDLKALHGVHLDLEVAILLLRERTCPKAAFWAVSRVILFDFIVRGGVSIWSVYNHNNFAFFRRVIAVMEAWIFSVFKL